MKLILILLIFFSTLFAGLDSDTKKIHKMYKANNFKKACKFGTNKINKYRKNETFISLYAFSCLKDDQIDKLASAAAFLKQSPEARSNSVFFSTILLQKKLLLHVMLDGFIMTPLKLPSTNHILSKVFDSFMRENTDKIKEEYTFVDAKNSNETYKLFTKDKKVIIEHYLNNNLLKTHKYW